MYQGKSKINHIGLQFFAEPNEPPQDPTPQDPPAEPPVQDPPPQDPPAGRTYTQQEIQSMMANEKRTARQALLKELGVEIKPGGDYKAAVKSIKDTLDAGKTQAQLDAEAKTAAEVAQKEAEQKAIRLEMKVAALSAGVNPKFLEEVTILAQANVTEDLTVDKVMEEFKTKYPAFFEVDTGDAVAGSSGTGGSTNPPRGKGATGDGLGKRLAGSVQKTPSKSTYFNH